MQLLNLFEIPPLIEPSPKESFVRQKLSIAVMDRYIYHFGELISPEWWNSFTRDYRRSVPSDEHDPDFFQEVLSGYVERHPENWEYSSQYLGESFDCDSLNRSGYITYRMDDWFLLGFAQVLSGGLEYITESTIKDAIEESFPDPYTLDCEFEEEFLELKEELQDDVLCLKKRVETAILEGKVDDNNYFSRNMEDLKDLLFGGRISTKTFLENLETILDYTAGSASGFYRECHLLRSRNAALFLEHMDSIPEGDEKALVEAAIAMLFEPLGSGILSGFTEITVEDEIHWYSSAFFCADGCCMEGMAPFLILAMMTIDKLVPQLINGIEQNKSTE